jgi:histone acetyltransferase (RNA polymerase elongator complex component)
LSKGVKKHFIIPIFIPHQGCPYRCVFCQQRTITNVWEHLCTPDDIRRTIETAMASTRFSSHQYREVAFYGGTFTSIPTSAMVGMLSSVRPFIREGILSTIRLSTRPDSIDEAKLDILESYGVSTVELGAQSMDDEVLLLSNRGHTASDTVTAVQLLKKRGFTVGVQLMPGLPGDSRRVFMQTIERVISMKPHVARLYPTLVLKGTKLARWYQEGRYTPMELEDTVSVCKEACKQLEASGISVIRIGLMSSPSLLAKGEIMAGPWHPSLGFLVRSALHIDRVRPYLPALGEAKTIVLYAPGRDIPLLRGYKNAALKYLESITGARIDGILPQESIAPGTLAYAAL